MRVHLVTCLQQVKVLVNVLIKINCTHCSILIHFKISNKIVICYVEQSIVSQSGHNLV